MIIQVSGFQGGISMTDLTTVPFEDMESEKIMHTLDPYISGRVSCRMVHLDSGSTGKGFCFNELHSDVIMLLYWNLGLPDIDCV